MEKDREERKECVKWRNFLWYTTSGICKLFVFVWTKKNMCMFMHVMRFLWNARESCFKCMVSISVSVASMCEWLAKSSEWQEGAIYCHLSGRELWWMFHVSFTNLCHSIVENQACKIISELKDGGKREKWSIDLQWACLFLFPQGRCVAIIYRNDYCWLCCMPKIVITFISDNRDVATFAPEPQAA